MATAPTMNAARPELEGGGHSRSRYWEIDLARTVAIAMMVTYHVGWDLDFLAPDLGIDAFSGGWRALQVATGSSFLFIAGLSFTVSDSSAARKGLGARARVAKHATRGAQVIGFGLLISLVTWIALDDDYVRFGILHAIGTAIVLAPFVARLGLWNAPFGVAVIVGGLLLRGTQSDIPGALILGFEPSGGAGVDYYPLLPWFGLFMLGIATGRVLYPAGRRGPLLARLGGGPPDWLTAPGRRSLGIYLVHQPILIAVLAGVLTVFGVEWSWSP